MEDLTYRVRLADGDFTFLSYDAYGLWVLIMTDEYNFTWVGSQLFTSRVDAVRWGLYTKDELGLCVSFRAVLLHDIFSSIEIASLISQL